MEKIRKLLGKRIQELRIAKNLTQEKLSESIGIDQRSLSSIECGHSFPSRFLFDISEALEISLPELFDFQHHAFTAEEMKDYIKHTVDLLPEDKLISLFRITRNLR